MGPQGRVLALRLNLPSSDDYGIDHGSVVIGDSIGGVQTYRWGGSRCNAVAFNDDQFAML